ncbi:MAG: hypothetical protein IT381_02390 [Deltaproteobacteria bacterium]|nr:hypothetical protein [Deltaproteobacteria bacterium]
MRRSRLVAALGVSLGCFSFSLALPFASAAPKAVKPGAAKKPVKKGQKPIQDELDAAEAKTPPVEPAKPEPAKTEPATPAETAAPAKTETPATPPPAPVETKPTEVKAAPAADAGGELQVPRERKKLIPALRVAVYDLELQDVAPSVGVIVTDSLLAEVRKLQGVSAIGMNEIRDMLSHEATKQLAGCSENADSCLADLAGALGVDELVTGKLATAGNERLILVRRIDQKRAEVVGTHNQRLKAGSGQEFLATVGPAVEDLFKGYELRGGVSRGVSKEVALKLDPPPIPTWATLTVGGVAVGAGIACGVFALLAREAEIAYGNKAKEGLPPNPQPVNGAELVAMGKVAEQRALATNVLIGVAGGVALVAVVMALFTDWKGYRDQLRKREEITKN